MKQMHKRMRGSGFGTGRRSRLRRPGDCRGQAIVEVAIATVVLTFLFAGTLDISRTWNAAETLAVAVRDGARVAALTPDAERKNVATTRVASAAAAYFDAADLDIDVDNDTVGSNPTVPVVTVTVTGDVPLLLGTFLPIGKWENAQKVVAISRSATFRDQVNDATP